GAAIALDAFGAAFYPLRVMKGVDIPTHIESLEGRIAPAGVITVAFENGALVLTGDNGDNDLSLIGLDQGTFQLSGTNGTVFQKVGTPDSDLLTLSGPIKSLAITLGAGMDTVAVRRINVGGDVAIDLGAGENSLAIEGVAANGGLEIKSGSDADTIQFEGGSS